MIAIPLLLAGLTVSLSPQAMVRGTEITLGEIAMISGGTPEEVALVSQVHLGYAPAPGYSRLLQGGLIAQQVRKALPGEALLFMGSTTCRVKPEVIVISAKRIRSVAREELDTILNRADAEITLTELLAAVTLPAGNNPQSIRLRASMRSASFSGGSGDGIWRVPVELLVDGSVYQTVWTQWTVEMWEERPVLLRDVAIGETLAPHWVESRRVRVRDASLTGVVPVNALSGFAARRNMRAGEIVRRRDVEPIVLVHEGDTVQLQVRRGAITARTRAKALEDGRIGEQIEVVTLDGGKHLSATVLGQDLVEVRIGKGPARIR
jgi:flagella basal body P-ring formation protein FlgA